MWILCGGQAFKVSEDNNDIIKVMLSEDSSCLM